MPAIPQPPTSSPPHARHGVELHGPLAGNTSSQVIGAFGLDAFTIDWDHQQV